MTETNPLENRFSKPLWLKPATLALLSIAGVYAIIYWDVVCRAKEAYLEGEKYIKWHEAPKLKSEFFEMAFQNEKRELDREKEKGRLSVEDYNERLEGLRFDRDVATQESSLKYAYQWYKDTYELFSPPESKWVRLAREKAPQVLEMWKSELRAQNIPFEDYMFE